MVVFKFRNLNTGQATPIPPGEFTIGRADEAYVHLEDGTVSRRHALVVNSDNCLYLEDLGSANGTAAHGALLTGRVQVKLGDVVHVGSVPFRIDPEVAGEPAAKPSAGMRAVNRAYMRKDTERLDRPSDSGVIAQPKIVVPEGGANGSTKSAQSLPPEEPTTVAPAKRMPVVRTGLTPLNQPPEAEPAPVPLPALPASTHKAQSAASMTATTELQPVRQTTSETPRPLLETQLIKTPTPMAVHSAPASVSSVTMNRIVFFLAGLGVGLLIGLIFARMFMEMGGKAAS